MILSCFIIVIVSRVITSTICLFSYENNGLIHDYESMTHRFSSEALYIVMMNKVYKEEIQKVMHHTT